MAQTEYPKDYFSPPLLPCSCQVILRTAAQSFSQVLILRPAARGFGSAAVQMAVSLNKDFYLGMVNLYNASKWLYICLLSSSKKV
jgi:hypothetical protein